MKDEAYFPAFFREKIQAEYGEESQKIFGGLRARRVTSFRANTLKRSAEEIESALLSAQIPFQRVEWYKDAFYIDPSFYDRLVHLPIYETGEIYLQSLSSMLPPLLLDPQPGEHILDMTAAPGGKTTQLSALSDGRALITACEKEKTRFDRLNYNLKKQGTRNVTAMHCDATKLDEFFRFDKILLDAPCSGSGTFSASDQPKIDENLLSRSLKAQNLLLKKAISLLKRGGTLVYSTCSILKEENEQQLLRALKGTGCELVFLEKLFLPTLKGEKGTLTVCPGDLFEGFFAAKIVRE